jgi:hypothetical protein
MGVVSLLICGVLAVGCGGGNNSTPPPADTTAPGPVTALVAIELVNAIGLNWTNPGDADLAGVLVVVGDGVAVTFTPVDGTSYMAAQVVAAGQEVLFVGAGAATQLSDPVPGRSYSFAVFAFDGARNYSLAATVSFTVDTLGAQGATISIDLGTGVLTVTGQPADLFLSGTAVYDNMAGTVTAMLVVRNDTERLLFNLKGLTTTVNEGTQSGSSLPGGGLPYTYYGPESLDVGSTATRTIDLTGITGGVDPIVMNLSFTDARMLYGGNFGGDFVGVDTSLSGEAFNVDFMDPMDAGENLRRGVMSQDGRFIFAGEKQTPFLSIIDTRTNTVAGGADLAMAGNGLGNVGGLDLSADGTRLYLVFNDGTHWHGSANDSGSAPEPVDVYVLELDADTLVELRRTQLLALDPDGRTGRELRLSADGTQIAVLTAARDGTANHLWVLDRATMAITDTDLGMPGIQPVSLSMNGQSEYGAWAEDGSDFFVGFNAYRAGPGAPPPLDVVDMATFVVSQLIPTGHGETSSVLTVHNGRLYYPSRQSSTMPLTIFNLATLTQVQPDPMFGSAQSTGVVIDPSGTRYYVLNHSDIAVFDLATDTRLDTDNDIMNGITNISAPEAFRAHMMVISPY